MAFLNELIMEIAAFESLTKQCFIKRGGIALNLPSQFEFLFPQAVIIHDQKTSNYLRYINTSDVLEDCYPARAARAR